MDFSIIKKILDFISVWAIPVIFIVIPVAALIKKVPIYETFIDGAKEGFDVGVRIIPYLVAIFFAIGMFKESGAIDMLAQVLKPLLDIIHFPVDVIPLAIIRPLSGSGALGIMADIANQYGGDSYLARMAAVMVGSSETTLYVLAVYFGAVGIKKFRHAVLAGLIADTVGIVTAVFISRLFFL